MASIINASTTSGVVITGDTSGNLALQTNNGNTAVTIDTSQNVGIGTTSPSYKFDVNGIIRGRSDAYLGFVNGSQAGVWWSQSNYSAPAFQGLTSAGNVGSVYWQPGGGQFAIGTTSTSFAGAFYVNSPSADIIVGTNGSTKEFAVANNGQIYAQFTSISSLSDRRAKENIEPIQYGLNEVTKLNPVTFKFIAHPELAPTYGFIAQDVQPVLPELVGEEKDNKAEDGTPYLTLKMGDMLPVLVKAIQELKALVDTQATEIAALQAKVGA